MYVYIYWSSKNFLTCIRTRSEPACEVYKLEEHLVTVGFARETKFSKSNSGRGKIFLSIRIPDGLNPERKSKLHGTYRTNGIWKT